MVARILAPVRIERGHVVYDCLTAAGDHVYFTIRQILDDLRSRRGR